MVKSLAESILQKKQNQHNYLLNLNEDGERMTSDKQLEFHKAPNLGRMFIGGNRSGKTVSGAMEAVWWITRTHPFYKLPEGQIEGRCGSVDFVNGVDKITKPEVKKWLAPSFLINGSWEDSWSNQYRTLTLANGNYLEFLSYDQDLDKWAGTARNFVWYDEEPPESIFEEGLVRLTSKRGRWWMTMTPVEGATWTLSELYETSKTHGSALKDIHVVEVEVDDNMAISQADKDRIFNELSPEQQLIRRQGKYVHGSGLIFTNFTKENIIEKLPFDPRRNPFRIVASVDLGLGVPTAWLWHALTPDGKVITFHEIVKADMTIPQMASLVHKFEKEYRIKPDFRVGDPAAKQRSRQTGLSDHLAYAQHGLPFALGNNEVSASLDKMNEYLRSGRWQITQNCAILIKEMRKYRMEEWATKKQKSKNNPKMKPRKKDDHAIDSTRYMFSFLPNLAAQPEDWKQSEIDRINQIARRQMGTVRGINPDAMFDESLLRQKPQSQPEYQAWDPTVGEF